MAHRGLWWRTGAGRNSPAAIVAAGARGYGVETDIRDRAGEVVIAHDPATDAAPLLRDVLAEWPAGGGPLALNVKADGLAAVTARLLTDFAIVAVTFDMSIPDQVAWIQAGVPTLSRWSDVEPAPVLGERAAGRWIDAMYQDVWWTDDQMRRFVDSGGLAAFVSPELHGRPYTTLWEHLAERDWVDRDSVLLCTDFPDLAEEFFS